MILAELITHKHAATNEQLWLRETFTTALDAYQSQQLDKACSIFLEILKTHPGDEPTKFFLDHCQKHKNKSLIDTGHHATKIDRK